MNFYFFLFNRVFLKAGPVITRASIGRMKTVKRVWLWTLIAFVASVLAAARGTNTPTPNISGSVWPRR